MNILLLIISFILSIILTYTIRAIANKKELLDHPNERSSHTVPTPKGGGLAIVLIFYSTLSYLFFQNEISSPLFFALLSGIPIVIVSFIDDIYPVPAKIRFTIQLISAVMALFFLNGVDNMNFSLFSLQGEWVNVLAIIGIVWLTNLYNFLDGIDGYAGGEAFFVGLASFILFGNDLALILAVAVAGFLMFNWHKASIFMGDVGSAPLGFIFAIFILNDASTLNFLPWLMLLSLFWFDATLTLIRRAKQKERLSQAHKKHAYQRLNQAGYRHDKVVLFATVVNIFIFIVLYLTPSNFMLYLFILLLMVLYGLTRIIDAKKAFE